MMTPRLSDPNPRIRAVAIASIATDRESAENEDVAAAIDGMMRDDDWETRAEIAALLGQIPEPSYQNELLGLLYDGEPRVALAALASIRERIERGGFNPVYLPTLISLLRVRRLKHEARDALVEIGEPAVRALVHFMNDTEEAFWVRRAVPKTLARIGTRAAVRALEARLDGDDAFQRRKVIEALGSVHSAADVDIDGELVEQRVVAETRTYLRYLADLQVLGLHASDGAVFRGPQLTWSGRAPTLLHSLLASRLAGQVRHVFGLLALIESRQDVWAAYYGLVGPNPALRTHALEYLDNALSGDVRRTVFLAIDDLTPTERFGRAEAQLGITSDSQPATLRRIFSERVEGDPDYPWLAAAAVHATYALQVQSLHAEVKRMADADPDPLVCETAAWVVDRLSEESESR